MTTSRCCGGCGAYICCWGCLPRYAQAGPPGLCWGMIASIPRPDSTSSDAYEYGSFLRVPRLALRASEPSPPPDEDAGGGMRSWPEPEGWAE